MSKQQKRTANREKVRKELLRLDSAGRLSPAEVVKAARDPKSPMHGYFTWDDSEAARMFREDQARTLISEFEITITVNKVELRVQEFVHPPMSNEQGYTAFTKFMESDDKSQARLYLLSQITMARGYLDRVLVQAQALQLTPEVNQIVQSMQLLEEKARAIAA
jgi:hypothetical protein